MTQTAERNGPDDANLFSFGTPDDETRRQLARCMASDAAMAGVLCADAHVGYEMPVGGVVAYRDAIAPGGVGYDIACGVKAVRTDIRLSKIGRKLDRIADRIARSVSFGIGRENPDPIDHPLFDDPAWDIMPAVATLKDLARAQLGTVGSGNHYVDLLVEPETDILWIAAHFGSRGLGHRIATGYHNLAAGRPFDAQGGTTPCGGPLLLPVTSELGASYLAAMEVAGRYAYAGRDYVVEQVLTLLGANATAVVHNHHNFAWRERHGGEDVYVVRKGATPCFPGQRGFVGGSMADIAVVIEGVDTELARRALFSAIHGAGRIMSRSRAAGKRSGARGKRKGGVISDERMQKAVRAYGVTLRGGAPDESPFVYRKLADVLAAHAGAIAIVHTLKPVVVVMAGETVIDPYKD
jgi:tRNA-splicing ligase RtcB